MTIGDFSIFGGLVVVCGQQEKSLAFHHVVATADVVLETTTSCTTAQDIRTAQQYRVVKNRCCGQDDPRPGTTIAISDTAWQADWLAGRITTLSLPSGATIVVVEADRERFARLLVMSGAR